jgi:hypothetical protein
MKSAFGIIYIDYHCLHPNIHLLVKTIFVRTSYSIIIIIMFVCRVGFTSIIVVIITMERIMVTPFSGIIFLVVIVCISFRRS